MRETDLNAIVAKASEQFPTIRWIGVLLDNGYDGASLCGVLDGLNATETFGGSTERTAAEAITNIAGRLREMWS